MDLGAVGFLQPSTVTVFFALLSNDDTKSLKMYAPVGTAKRYPFFGCDQLGIAQQTSIKRYQKIGTNRYNIYDYLLF